MECLKILELTSIHYINFLQKRDMQRVAEVWFECLQDLDFSLSMQVLKNHITTNNFPPTVAHFTIGVEQLKGDTLNDKQALILVSNFMRNGIYKVNDSLVDLKNENELVYHTVKLMGASNMFKMRVDDMEKSFTALYRHVVNDAKNGIKKVTFSEPERLEQKEEVFTIEQKSRNLKRLGEIMRGICG